ncbi:Mth938-like domain-containing protein [Amaricoccus macauensis]|uniref:Mth938-like domain-containing protein n=1 Tax=Amaricoccus macauensis TaxID=57001 RepID=UPI003C7D62F5
MLATEVLFPDGAVPIDSYGAEGFRLRGQVVHGAIALFQTGVSNWAGLHDLSVFADRAGEFDVLLVGVGGELVAPDASFVAERARLEAAGIGVEIMTTPSACRTYNVLLAEGRRVAAALMPV